MRLGLQAYTLGIAFENGNLVSLEILDASKRVTEARKIEFETVE